MTAPAPPLDRANPERGDLNLGESGRDDLFLGLTPERVLAAVDAAGLVTTGLCYPLNSFENRVYEVGLTDGSRVVAKFYRPGRWNEAQILEEHRFLADLEAEEVPVCPLRPFPDGSTLRTQDGIFYSLAERRGGRAPDEMSEALARRLGRLAARLHNVAARGEAPHRLRLDADTYLRAPASWMERRGTIPAPLAARYFDAAQEAADLIDQALDGVPVHRLHGDLHLGNLLFRPVSSNPVRSAGTRSDPAGEGILHVLDFDDMVVGPEVQDLWLAIPGVDQEALSYRDVFLKGYEELRLFDRSTLRLIEPLRTLRRVHYAAWLARRWHDPIFPATWTHFGTDPYWQQETEDLEYQLRLLRREPGAAGASAGSQRGGVATGAGSPGDDEEELTNADFFWDWEG